MKKKRFLRSKEQRLENNHVYPQNILGGFL